MERTVLRMLDDAATTFASDPYAYKKTDSGYVALTFSEAREAARDFAAWLLLSGCQKGDAIAILAEGSPEWIMGELGLLTAGCVSVPLSIKLLQEEIPFRLSHSEAKAVLTTRNQLDKVLGAIAKAGDTRIKLVFLDPDADSARETAVRAGFAAERVIGLEEAIKAGRAARARPEMAERLEAARTAVGENDTANICYTSGTTGNPKGIMLTHLNYWTNCHDGVELFHMPRGLRTLIILPTDHSFAHTAGLYVALIIGMVIYFVDSRGGGIATLRNIPINLKESKPNLLLTVPALSGNFMKKIISGVEEKGGLIERIFKAGISAGIAYNGNGYNKPPLLIRLRSYLPYHFAKILIFNKIKKMVFGPNIKYCVGGGALLDIKQQEFFAAFGVPIYQGYGLTEAAPVISSNSPVAHKYGTSGHLCPSIECRLVKSNGESAKVGEIAEIVIRGENVMKGYFKNPAATAEALRDGWLYTGDLAYMDADGFLVVVGREKALLIAEDGEKYSPEEIEEAVSFSTDVIDQIMAWCEQRKYAIALVSLDCTKVERLIKSRAIASAEDLLVALKAEFEHYRDDPKAKKVQPAWTPAVFQIIDEGFSDKDGTVNSTMKIVRHRIGQVHRDRIEYSYTAEGSKTLNTRNLAALRKMFKLA
jgi:long-chain acyl-CoA synthetase